MADILMYTTTYCPFCMQARRLFDQKGIPYKEINLDEQAEKRAEMLTQSEGRRTVPQIFIDGKSYGGFDDVNALEKKGRLDTLLGVHG